MKRALWIVNGLLAVGIVAFSALAFPARTDRLQDLDFAAALPSPPRPPQPPANEAVLLTLPNPLGPRSEPSLPPASMLALHGSLPTISGDRGVAFVRTARNSNVVVPIGEEVEGWRLEELWRDQAAFTNRRGERKMVQIAR